MGIPDRPRLFGSQTVAQGLSDGALLPSGTRIQDLREARTLLKIAAFLQRLLPRGKGAIPRWIGRVFLGANSHYLTTRHGVKLVLSPDSLDIYGTMWLDSKSWDYHDFLTCVAATPDAATFYDIGANVGYFSLELVPITKGAVQVFAFEPQSDLASAIRSSANLNSFDNVVVFEILAGDVSADSNLFVSAASIHASAVSASGRKAKRVLKKRMVRIDDLVIPGSIPPPDFVKMDVEGGEHLIFRGARRTFEKFKPNIFLEYLPGYPTSSQVRREVELLAACVDYDLLGHRPFNRAKNSSKPFFRIKGERDWLDIDSLFLKNPNRPVRDPRYFEA